MFDNIAHRYDFLNRVLSVGIDKIWRRNALRELDTKENMQLLDVATGTGDVAIALGRKFPKARIKGLDLSSKMVAIGKQKVTDAGLTGIELMVGDAEALPFEDNQFDAVTVAFGVRNFEHLEQGLGEIQRVLKPGGKLIVLEFSSPRGKLFRPLFQFYFKNILPRLGNTLSNDTEAYDYLFRSVQAFPAYEAFTGILQSLGYRNTIFKPQTMGVCCIYVAEK